MIIFQFCPLEVNLKRLKRLTDKLHLKNFFIISKNFCDLENEIMAQDL